MLEFIMGVGHGNTEPGLTYGLFLSVQQSNFGWSYGSNYRDIDAPTGLVSQFSPDGTGVSAKAKVDLPLSRPPLWPAPFSANWGPSWTTVLAERWAAHAEGRRAVLLPCNVGATSFADGHWIVGGDLYLQALDTLQAAAPYFAARGRIEASFILPSGGEGEASAGWTGQQYKDAMAAAVAGYRAVAPAARLIIPGMVPEWAAGTGGQSGPAAAIGIQQALTELPGEISNCAFYARPAGYNNAKQSQTIHASAQGQRLFGNTVADGEVV